MYNVLSVLLVQGEYLKAAVLFSTMMAASMGFIYISALIYKRNRAASWIFTAIVLTIFFIFFVGSDIYSVAKDTQHIHYLKI